MKINSLKLSGTYEISLEPRQDSRGYFMRTYDDNIFNQYQLVTNWVQENQSLSLKQGIIRGLHFQRPPHAETKLIRVLRGAILDVFVDLRRTSSTYGQWDSLELSEDNHKLVYIPKGFAHGFCTLSDQTLVSYKVDSCYQPDSEGGLLWNDPGLNIVWSVKIPQLSEKDLQWHSFKEFETPFT
ncbi:dTDP-4-dehydrorhamnose 3,5-epimerase [Gloeocapsa sp. PCC 73106]|uniref:dTDP-4-dehydrorhamnose 3,5-epimerase n=1 Tax=Gloeocapsa sp. PCC 73106 TaxID=102232 RepID=UPI0002ACBC6E|nr:dTDP-4-dehydrorhamnose 3,5-epimerase [Gloeocapsa sp. PCC 73106]ELR98321.1 dTDP-4-dehydrorhamnose 3,5-epimerase [Gloeocapsa sp. PCC 73106]